MLAVILSWVLAYVICGIPFGKILCQLIEHVDVQEHGSGNIGTTNVVRVGGWKLGALTLALDAGKGALSMYISSLIFAALAPELNSFVQLSWVFLLCLVGHIFSPYLHFKGGKGIAVGVGALYVLSWPMATGLLALFGVLAGLTKRVSVGSLAAAIGIVPALLLIHAPLLSLIPGALGSVLVLWAHRSNILRLLSGNEKQLSSQEHEKTKE